MKHAYFSAFASLLALSATPALAQTAAYIQWPLSRNASDSAAVRSANITPGTNVLRHYVLSSGQPVTIATGTTMAYPQYSKALGQAFGWNASGGGWSSTAPSTGPGSTVRRGNNDEFSLTATGALKVDSLIYTISAANSANGFLALTYSKSGFTTDSAEFTGGKAPDGPLAAGADGTFTATGSQPSNAAAASRINFPQYNSANSDRTRTYRMAFNGATGLTLASGNKLAVRFHVAVSSSSEGRYVLLKNVIIKSRQSAALSTRSLVATDLNLYPNPVQDRLTVPHAAATSAARVLVYSATGAQVMAQPTQPGSLETSVALGRLAPGLYLVEYADGTTRSTARLVKE